MERPVPLWITIVSGLIAAMGLFVGCSLLLKVSLIAYCLMNIQDAVIGSTRGDHGLLISASAATVLSGVLVYVLSRTPAPPLSQRKDAQ